MNICVGGSSGLIGSALVDTMRSSGHRVVRLVRGSPGEGDVFWSPGEGWIDAAGLEGLDAIVHLGGENIATGRWTQAKKERIRESRVAGTRLLSQTLAELDAPPKVFACASAIGFYGSRGDDVMDEASVAGDDFLAGVCQQWEAATTAASEAGIRVANLRIGVVLSRAGGALAKMLMPFRLGLGGRVGSGRQYWSWITLSDVTGAIGHVLAADSLSGPVNLVAPQPVTNLEFTKTLGRVLSRPTVFPMPAFAARLALGEMADALLLSSTRVRPGRLLESGYEFRHTDLNGALIDLLGKG